MSVKSCGNCKKTVYVNEKMEAEGKWYHRACFKCMALGCNTPLTLRTLQMAALDDSVLDPKTNRPHKVLVCKDHVPMPKHSSSADTLAFKHTNSTPKPSIPGLHRSMMGERSKNPSSEVERDAGGANGGRLNSPRSLDEGSHAEILKSIKASQKAQDDNKEKEEKEEKESGADDHVEEGEAETPLPTTTLPKYRQGQFTVSAPPDSTSISHRAAEDAQDVTKDDDSFRTLPIRHADYEHSEEGAAEEKKEGEWEDNKQERVFRMKGEAFEAIEVEEPDKKKLGAMALSSKLMDHKKHGRNESKDTKSSDKASEKEVEEKEWDSASKDDLNRREAVAGI
ncbi:hypothetical protein EDD11_004680 [Mortierella claussenii]|nr:hypothetical protein EDD11_004680 [Mortierella claussenii]